jgi:RNA polymerase sigma factor (sigma-70 family)
MESGDAHGGDAAQPAKQPDSPKRSAPPKSPNPKSVATRTRRKPQPPDYVTAEVLERARRVAESTQHELLVQAVRMGPGCEVQRLNNALMDAFRELSSVEAYSLLFELNVRPFSMIAARIMRMTGSRADPNDILQEAFLAIYRYPSRFRAEKPNAFRNWSYSIIRNTVYRHLSHSVRDGIPADMLADVLEDENASTPAQASEDKESAARCRRVYGLLLSLYSYAYANELKDRDRLALELVEVQGMGYREATEVLGIRLENFKMVVCRARKKIFQSMVRVLGTQQS